MTDDRLNGLGTRMDRVEQVLASAGEFLLQASALAQQNTIAIEQNAVAIGRLTQRVDSLAQRVDSLAAASERHDRILDYLLGQQRNSDN